MRKEFNIKDSNNKSLITFYYDGNEFEKVPKIKKHINKILNFVLQIIAMNYENEDIEDIYEYSEVLDEELGYIFHLETINALSNLYEYPQLVREKIYLLREIIGPMINNTLDEKMKTNAPEWERVSKIALEIIEALGKKQINPSEFGKSIDMSMDWL